MFVHFWALYLILGITEEGKTLLQDFATGSNTELHNAKSIFHYITGPVNIILKGFKTFEMKKLKSRASNFRTRLKQILQHDLTYMFVTFLLNYYGQEEYEKNPNTEHITNAIKYVNEHITLESRGEDKIRPPNQICLIFLLGYAAKMAKWYKDNSKTLSFHSFKCTKPFSDNHNISAFTETMDTVRSNFPGGESTIPKCWDINIHYKKVVEGKIKWKSCFGFDDYWQDQLNTTKKRKTERKKEKKTHYKSEEKHQVKETTMIL